MGVLGVQLVSKITEEKSKTIQSGSGLRQSIFYGFPQPFWINGILKRAVTNYLPNLSSSLYVIFSSHSVLISVVDVMFINNSGK